ncbi:MAG TPA: hypothetical protein VHI93_08150 [Candidatus Thermoplasmatota archaeon]|nr:hypothetical protein [Candidatus Thermoplasmatota archaeon]
MGEILVHRRIVHWGNGFGIRLTKGDLERLGLRPRDEAEVLIRGQPKGVDLGNLPTLHLGGDASLRHDDIIGEGLDAGP